jgi:hypothetical protein
MVAADTSFMGEVVAIELVREIEDIVVVIETVQRNQFHICVMYKSKKEHLFFPAQSAVINFIYVLKVFLNRLVVLSRKTFFFMSPFGENAQSIHLIRRQIHL